MNNKSLHTLFQLTVKSDAPEFIIYSSKLSERLNYTCQFIFESILNCKCSITDNKQLFKNSSAFKISYSTHSEKEIINISPYDLLFKAGVDESYKPKGTTKNGALYFHMSDSSCDLGYDIFASVFYFISRYEEWQPFEADKHGRFELQQSILFKDKQYLKPVVNSWIEELKQALLKFYPSLKFPQKKFQYISTIDVDNLYAYKNKGASRTLGAIAKDILTFKFGNLSRRLKVLKGKIKDPFDVYDELSDLSKKTTTPLFYFFLQRSGTEHDRTIAPSSSAFKEVFEKLNKNGVEFGLHPSYETVNNDELLKQEFDIIRNNSGSAIQISRQHYLRFTIKTTPKQLIANGVMADFSIGFAAGAGYRAGTFTPFYYYDLEKEKVTELLMVPFAVMDGVYFIYSNTGVEQAERQMLELAEEAKRLNGIFVTVFHERTFDEALYPGFGGLYRKLQAI
ncbi:MAG: polysaccharide deacetylase family protein [Sphingobacteriaceae bacterium]|nr:polysaccharide deacetylase family protein [Sphingobacteriaceae bacterium]